jgi:hypothetical protein
MQAIAIEIRNNQKKSGRIVHMIVRSIMTSSRFSLIHR